MDWTSRGRTDTTYAPFVNSLIHANPVLRRYASWICTSDDGPPSFIILDVELRSSAEVKGPDEVRGPMGRAVALLIFFLYGSCDYES